MKKWIPNRMPLSEVTEKMTFALVPPELHLSNHGLVDTVKFDFTDLIVT